MTEVLAYVQYNRDAMLETVRQETEHALQNKQISLSEARLFLQNFEHCLNGYTYLGSQG